MKRYRMQWNTKTFQAWINYTNMSISFLMKSIEPNDIENTLLIACQ